MTQVLQLLETLRPVLLIGWLPAAVACVGAVAALVADMLDANKTGVALAAGALALAALVALATALLPPGAQGVSFARPFGVVLTGGLLAGLATVVYLTGALACASGLMSIRRATRVPVAALIAVGAATGQVLLGADDLVVLFIALELLALIAYALVAAAGTDRSDEAAARYFVQGSVATGLAVLGLAVLVGLSGGASTYTALGSSVKALAPGAALLGGMLLVSALAFKVGAFPFHSWVPDAYETAPSGAAAFLSSGVKAAAIGGLSVLFARLLVVDPFTPVADAIRVLAVASIVFGNLVALKQTSAARMLGYSAIAQAGYAFVGVSVSLRDSLLFAATYALGACVAFLALEYFRNAEPEWNGSISGLAGFSKRHPAVSLSLAVALLSMTGIPMTVGFWGKYYVFLAAAASGLLWLTIIGLLGSAVSFGYYGAVIRSLYIDPAAEVPEDDYAGAVEPRAARAWPSIVGALLIVVAGIAPLVWGLSLVYALFKL